MYEYGHLAEMSPKCHPELAGCGIEYSWGKAKMHFRRSTDHVAKHLHDNILKSISEEVLQIDRIRRYARKARSYRRACKAGKSDSHENMEKQLKIYRSHGSAMDIDWVWIKNN